MTPEEVDQQGSVQMDIDGKIVLVSTQAGDAYKGKPLGAGPWYDVSLDNIGPSLSLGRVKMEGKDRFAVYKLTGSEMVEWSEVTDFDAAIRSLLRDG